MMRRCCVCALLAAGSVALFGQAPFQVRSASTISYGVNKHGDKTVDITNVAYELAGDTAPGRPPDSRLVLRSTMRSQEVVGDKGVDATVTLEAWPLGANLQSKPRYTVKVTGIGAQTVEGDLWVVDRSIDPDVNWWSVYNLGTGRHLLDTYVELVRFSISRETVAERYAGLDIPPDNTPDARLKDRHVVGLVVYASAEKVVREALITCDDAERAAILRSYADSSHQLALMEDAPDRQALRVTITDDYPSPPKRTVMSIPIAQDDLDLAHADLPAGLHVAPFRR